MTHPVAATASRSWAPTFLLMTSATLFALQIWNIARWIQAFDLGNTQTERVAIYLQGLPDGLGQLSTFELTWLLILCGVLGLACAIPASRAPGMSRVLGVILIVVNAVVVLWLLFTLM